MDFRKFIEECSKNEEIHITHAIVAAKQSILAEYVKEPYKMDTRRLFFSMTKSFASLAVGIAFDRGLINLDEPIVHYFKEELPEYPHPNLCKITVRHLLTMSGGMHDNTYGELVVQKDWVRAFLAQAFPHEPGTYYNYSTHGSHMLSALITKVTGTSLEDFLNQYLFYPMGIYEAQWEKSPEGLTAGGMGLSLYPMSLVKVAQMLLNKGIYQEKQLISAEYLHLATTRQIQKSDQKKDADSCFKGSGYGFQFHVGKDGCYRMDGAFGQICFLCPEKELAVIVFSQKSNTEALLGQIHKYLLVGTQERGGRIAETQDQELISMAERSIPCGIFALNQNEQGIHTLQIAADKEDAYQLILKTEKVVNTIHFSPGNWSGGEMDFVKDLQDHLQEYVCAAKYTGDTLVLKVYLIETPYVVTYTVKWTDGGIRFGFAMNVSLTLRDFTVDGQKNRGI